jgi:hypothetical protein
VGDAKEGLVVSCADTIETYRTHVSILFKFLIKVEKILKDSLNSIPSHSPSLKIQIMDGKVCLMCKGKTLLVCCQHPAMFCLYISRKFSGPYFECSLKVKVMGSNADYLLKYVLL